MNTLSWTIRKRRKYTCLEIIQKAERTLCHPNNPAGCPKNIGIQ